VSELELASLAKVALAHAMQHDAKRSRIVFRAAALLSVKLLKALILK
jgi:hypothetical protein